MHHRPPALGRSTTVRPLRPSPLAGLLAALLVLVTLAACSTPFGGPAGCNNIRGCPPTEPSGLPEDFGPYVAGRSTFTVDDPVTGRTLVTDVWYPVRPAAVATSKAPLTTYVPLPGVSYESTLGYDSRQIAPGRFPLVVYGHRDGGDRFEASYLVELLATHGFVVVSPDHPGDTLTDLVSGTSVPHAEAVAERPADVAGVLRAVLDGAGNLREHIDPSRVGLVGFDLGGYAAIATAAGTAGMPSEVRLRAVVALGPTVRETSARILRGDRLPTLVIIADHDRIAAATTAEDRTYQLVSGRPLFEVVLGRSLHDTFTDLCTYAPDVTKAKLPAAAKKLAVQIIEARANASCGGLTLIPPLAHGVIAHYTVAFLQQHVGDDRAAAQFMAKIPHAQVHSRQ